VSFKLTLTRSQDLKKLEDVIKDGNIIVSSDCLSNIFIIFKNKISDILNDWDNQYSELKRSILLWKNERFNDDNNKSQIKKFKICDIERGSKIIFVFLAIHYVILNPNKLKCFELYVKYEFKAYHHQATGLI